MVLTSGNLVRKIVEVVHFWGIKNILSGVNIALKYYVEVEKCYFTFYVAWDIDNLLFIWWSL